MKCRVITEEHPCVLARDLCEFEYDMDLIPAHRDASAGKMSPVCPIFWTSLQSYFFSENYDDQPGVKNERF